GGVGVGEARGRGRVALGQGVVDPLRAQGPGRRPVPHVHPPPQHVVVVGKGQPARVRGRDQLVAVVVERGGGARVGGAGGGLAAAQVVAVAPLVARRVFHRAEQSLAVERVGGRVVGPGGRGGLVLAQLHRRARGVGHGRGRGAAGGGGDVAPVAAVGGRGPPALEAAGLEDAGHHPPRPVVERRRLVIHL